MKRLLHSALITLCCFVFVLTGFSSLYADWCSQDCLHCQQKVVVEDCCQESPATEKHSSAHVDPEGECKHGAFCSVSGYDESVLFVVTTNPDLLQLERANHLLLNLVCPVVVPALFFPIVVPRSSSLHVLNCVYLI
ncbi:MAG: hypothetical protein OCC45_08795 [Desulfotalea sp.]